MNRENVSAGKPKVSGSVFRAAPGTTLPTGAAAKLPDGFSNLGYLSDAGLTNSTEIESGTVKAWGGDVVLNWREGKKDLFKFKLLEILNPDVLKAVHGDGNVTGDLTSGIAVNVNADDGVEHAWVFDMMMKGNVPKRIVVPSAAVTAIGDVVYVGKDAVGYEITLTASADKAGNTHYEYIGGNA